jgi:hypothetical protein
MRIGRKTTLYPILHIPEGRSGPRNPVVLRKKQCGARLPTSIAIATGGSRLDETRVEVHLDPSTSCGRSHRDWRRIGTRHASGPRLRWKTSDKRRQQWPKRVTAARNTLPLPVHRDLIEVR